MSKKVHFYFCFAFFLMLTIVHSVCADHDDDQRKWAFNYVYKNNNVWKGTESVSGPGSTDESTHTLRWLLPGIIKALNAHTMIDAGCGDLYWIKNTRLGIDYYIGIDIVEDLIAQNKRNFKADWIEFFCCDIVKDRLSRVDLIFCRDCLQHLSYKDAQLAINNFKDSGSQYLLTTHYFNLKANDLDIKSGNFHIIHLMKEPFNFPEPLISFDELSAESDMLTYRKRMCVWRLSDVPQQKV